MQHDSVSKQVEQLYSRSIVCDLALGFEPEIECPYKWEILDSYRTAGVNYISLHMATDLTSLERTMSYMATVLERLNQGTDKYLLIRNVNDIELAKQAKKLGICLVFQGTNPINKNIGMIDIYYQLGVRSMILSYNIRSAIGDGCIEPSDAGLSRLGIQVVKKMNQVGMLIDCSHTGYRTSMDAINISTAPVIFSHSNVYALCQHPRNLKDDLIKACAATGGVIGINGNGSLLGDENASLQKYVDHINYIADLVGCEHVALGTDQVYFPELMNNYFRDNAVLFSQSYTVNTTSQKQWIAIKPQQLLEIVNLLVKCGYNEIDIKGILGENYLRVIKQVWN